MKSEDNKKGCSDKLEKPVIRNINENLMKENEERIDEEVNLINVQTDDTEDELDEEEDNRNLEEN